jgi:hypothetical protein
MTPKKFLADIASDPEKLGRFILDPEGVLNEAKIEKKHHIHIKNAIAQHVHQALASTPEAYTVIIC